MMAFVVHIVFIQRFEVTRMASDPNRKHRNVSRSRLLATTIVRGASDSSGAIPTAVTRQWYVP